MINVNNILYFCFELQVYCNFNFIFFSISTRSPSEIYSLMKKGAQSRATAATKLNDISSRSHAVFIIIIEQMRMDKNDHQIRHLIVSKLNLVDLAGSERARVHIVLKSLLYLLFFYRKIYPFKHSEGKAHKKSLKNFNKDQYLLIFTFTPQNT